MRYLKFIPMKNTVYTLLAIISIYSCKQKVQPAQSPVKVGSIVYESYGAPLDAQSVRSMSNLVSSLSTMRQTDTIFAKVEGTIKSICAKKGCWMTLETASEKDMMVSFKDYGFFMPLDAKGTVIVDGKAYVSETSVEDLKHYAEDAGASKEEIEAIVSPKISYSFEAEGVLLAN
jgi:hypothetical protein